MPPIGQLFLADLFVFIIGVVSFESNVVFFFEESFLQANYVGVVICHYGFYFLIVWFYATAVPLYYVLFCLFKPHLIYDLVSGFVFFSIFCSMGFVCGSLRVFFQFHFF